MPRMRIWNQKEIDTYDYPPIFNAYQRKLFFTLPASLDKKTASFHHLTNKIGFYLMFGYFKACKRFFTPARFREEDIQAICQLLGVFSFGIDITQYNRKTYVRHQQTILNYFGYKAYDPKVHTSQILQAIHREVQAQLRPRLILDHLLEWLETKRIELPSYHQLQQLVTDAIGAHKQQLLSLLEKHLIPMHEAALDQLFQQVGAPINQPYLLTHLKKLTPSEQNKYVKANLEKLRIIWEIFTVVQPLIQQIGLKADAIRYYGELVIHYEVFQISRRKKLDQYLLLLAFVAYQVYCFEDWMVDTFLSGCRTALNQAQKGQKDYLYTHRKAHRTVFRKLVSLTEEKLELLESIQQIIWADSELLSPGGKVAYIQDLLPLTQKRAEEIQLDQIKSQYLADEDELFYQLLEEESLSLQKQVAGIVKQVHFNQEASDTRLLKAIEHFRLKEGKLTQTAPADFLSDAEKEAVFPEEGQFRISLYKALLFKSMFEHIKAGSLNLEHSYRYKNYDQYLIDQWKSNRTTFLQEANLIHLEDGTKHLVKLKKQLDDRYYQTNQNILENKNPHIRFHKDGKFRVNTPARIVEESQDDLSLFPDRKIIPLSEILATVEKLTGYLDSFDHLQYRSRKERPDKRVFLAGITAYGCNLGVPTMTKVAFPISESELEHTVNWYFSLENIDKANDRIVNFTQNLDLPNLYREHQEKLSTSSDGQRIPLNYPYALHASYSGKYFRKGKGVSAYSFIDERDIPFYSTIINTSDREAIYVVDGLMHNEVFHSTRHSTDSHGQTEAVFGLTHLLGFGFAPRIAKLYKQQIYSFTKRKNYEELKYKILPDGYINTQLIEENWDQILRLIASIKLKICTASQIFKRLNSYSRQHPVYQALKEYGKIIKSLYILQYVDDLELRQMVQRQLNKIEHANRFSNAIFFNNGGEMIFPTRQEQRVAEACKRLIKSAIVCWNYLYLSKKIAVTEKGEQRQKLLKAIKAKSPMTWQHIYFHGLYDFSEEKLADSYSLTYAQYINLKLA